MANKLSNGTEPADRPTISDTLGLAKRETQQNKCWIREALDEKTCLEHRQVFSTIVYTRGELQNPISGSNARTDGYIRGKIQVLPPKESCIFDCPIADMVGTRTCYFIGWSPEQEKWLKEKLISHHFANRLHVYDRFKNKEYMERVLDQDNMHERVLNEVSRGDPLLHRTGAHNVRRTFPSIPFLQLGNVENVALERFLHDQDALFDLEWSLLTDLESLCLNIRGIEEERRESIEALFVKMGRHLRLKTLVLVGVPQLIDFDLVDSEEYVAKQEDDEFLVFPGDEYNTPTELTNYIHFLKECLRPGGKLRLIVSPPDLTRLHEC